MASLLDQLLGRGKAEPKTKTASEKLSINDSLLRRARSSDWIAAIDFGTTYSKAAMVRNLAESPSQSDAHILPLGDNNEAFLPSALFIHNNRIVFGQRAFENSSDLNDTERLRFESPKRLISAINRDELQRKADAATDPTQTFKNADLLVLLLGFLAYRLQSALTRIEPLNGAFPALRISRPAWHISDEEEGEALLRSYLGRAFLLAGTIGETFEDEDGLPVEHAQEALRLANEYDSDPGEVFDELLAKFPNAKDCIGRGFVPESTAVAAAHIDSAGGHGRVLVVVDVGGGTSDFGAFLTAPGTKRSGRIGEIVSVRRSLAKGGDELDRLLLHYLKRRNNHDEGVPASQAPLARLRRRIRTIKEELFRKGSLVGEFEGDLQEFLDEPAVRTLGSELSEVFSIPFERACEYESTDRPLKIVRTGGSSTLKFVRALGQGKPTVTAPSWITDHLWQAMYPQLAVAIGAAMPQMPEQR